MYLLEAWGYFMNLSCETDEWKKNSTDQPIHRTASFIRSKSLWSDTAGSLRCGLLKDELGRKLDLAAGVGCGGDDSGRAESGGGSLVGGGALGGARGEDDLVGKLEVGVVEDVEELRTELRREAVAQLDVLEHRVVEFVVAGSNGLARLAAQRRGARQRHASRG